MATATKTKKQPGTDRNRTRTRESAAGGSASAKKSAPTAPRARKGAKVKDAIAPFEGFPKDFFPFFRELAKNNDREWFAANKERYLKTVQAPILSFIAAMDLPLGRFADCFVCEAKASGGSMFRIYNDMRFHDAKRYVDLRYAGVRESVTALSHPRLVYPLVHIVTRSPRRPSTTFVNARNISFP